MTQHALPSVWSSRMMVIASCAAMVAGCSANVPRGQPPVQAVSDAADTVSMGQNGTCSFTAPVADGSALPDGWFVVSPAHPLIRYMGRFECEPSGPKAAWPAAQIHASFVGDGVDVMLRDQGDGTLTGTVSYAAWIDDRDPILIETDAKRDVYPVARGLGPGIHRLQLWKRSESQLGHKPGLGKTTFLGLRLPAGGHLVSISPRTRRLEFIGDSITCGYGNSLITFEPQNHSFTTKGSDASMSYGAILARRLDADYVAAAYSGRGVVRNYADEPGDVLPNMYLRTFPDEPAGPAWDVGRYVPDALVINLGSNDFSPPKGPDRSSFRQSYLAFVERLRGYHPHAPLFVVLGPMLQDSSAWGAPALTHAREDLKWVVESRQKAGDRAVHFVEFPPQEAPYGEDWHPTIATHRQMADVLEPVLRQALGWTTNGPAASGTGPR